MKLICFKLLCLSAIIGNNFGFHFIVRHVQTNSRIQLRMDGEDSLILTGLPSYIEKSARPPHIGVPRKRMELPFAVQLMRTSYNTVDDLDFVPMDEFQKSFFLFRQSEWEDYRKFHPNVMQGDLADALYFDFISFAQYAVISNKMKFPKQQFVEKVGAEGENIVVRRDKKYEIDDYLPSFHQELVGSRILDYILEKYPTITPKQLNKDIVNNKNKISFDQFKDFSQQILDIFSINSYALNCVIKEYPTTNQENTQLFGVELQVPANLWSFQVLKNRKDLVLNDFEVKVVREIAKRCGLKFSLINSEIVNNLNTLHIIKVSA